MHKITLNRFLRVTIFSLSLLAVSVQGFGQIIGWDAATVPNGSFGPSPWTPATLDTHLSSSGLYRGASIGVASTPANFCWGGANGWSTASADANSFYFTFQAVAGYKVSLSAISSATRKSDTGPTGCAVWYAVGSGAFVKIADWTTTASSGTTGTANSTALTGIAALQNIAPGVTVKFRVIPQGSTTGNYYLTGGTNSLKINGSVVPAATINAAMSGTTGICIGEPANIKATITGGTGPYQLVYTDGTTNTTINNYVSGTNIPVTPTATTTYTIVSVTDANSVPGTNYSGSAIITVNALPVVAAANIVTCVAGAFTLNTGTPAGGTYSIPNPYNGPSTTFTYTYTNSNNCSKTSAVYTFTRNTSIVVTSQPETAGQQTCLGSSFNPLIIAATGSGAISYQWYSNTTASTSGGTPLNAADQLANGSRTASYTPLATATGTLYYYATVSNSCGTVKTAISGAFVTDAAVVAGSVSSNQIICAGTAPADLILSGQNGSIIKWQLATNSGFTSGLQDIPVTTVTLPGTAIGNLLQTSYIRAIVTIGSCVAVASESVEIRIKSTTWNGGWSNGAPDLLTSVLFASDFNSPIDIEACSVVVNAGNVVIRNGKTLTIQNALQVNGGSLVFENNASLVQINDAVNSGNIVYKRDTQPMVAYDYTYWSSPVGFQILADFSPQTRSDKYFWWDTAAYEWAAVAVPGITPMTIGRGYIIRAPASFNATPAIFTGDFIGVPNNGRFSVPIGVTSLENNVNLIGNPYPGAISADLFMSDPENAAAIGTGSTIYLWTHNTAITNHVYSDDYAAYNYTGGTGTAPATGTNNNRPNGYIAAGQGFFIKGQANGTAVFKNSMRVGINDQFFKSGMQNHLPDLEKNRIWLELKNQAGIYKEILVGYVEKATDGLDRGFDGEAFETTAANFYSFANETKLAIQARGLPFDANEKVALGFNVPVSGDLEIALSGLDGLFSAQDIYLEDRLLHTIHNLKLGSYTFASAAGNFDSRFVLLFENGQLQTNNPDTGSNAIIAYKDHTEIVVNCGTSELSEVRLFDMSGRLLHEEKNINRKETRINAGNFNAVLLVKTTLKTGQQYANKIVN